MSPISPYDVAKYFQRNTRELIFIRIMIFKSICMSIIKKNLNGKNYSKYGKYICFYQDSPVLIEIHLHSRYHYLRHLPMLDMLNLYAFLYWLV